MRPLSEQKRKEIEEFLTKGKRKQHNKESYISLVLFKNKKEKRMRRSRAYYQYFNRVELDQFDIIHHRDENKQNDDIKNLELMTTEEHATNHHAGVKHRHHKPRINSNRLKDELINKIIDLSKKKEYKFQNGRINYSKIGRELQISNFTVARYIKEGGNKHGSISPV